MGAHKYSAENQSSHDFIDNTNDVEEFMRAMHLDFVQRDLAETPTIDNKKVIQAFVRTLNDSQEGCLQSVGRLDFLAYSIELVIAHTKIIIP